MKLAWRVAVTADPGATVAASRDGDALQLQLVRTDGERECLTVTLNRTQAKWLGKAIQLAAEADG